MKELGILATLMTALALTGCLSAASGNASAPTEISGSGSASATMKVGSYNIRNSGGDKGTVNGWGKRKADLAALIGEL